MASASQLNAWVRVYQCHKSGTIWLFSHHNWTVHVLCSVSYYLKPIDCLLLRMCTHCRSMAHPALRITLTVPHSLGIHKKLNCTLPPVNTTLVFLPGDYALDTNITVWGAVGGAAGCRHLQCFTGILHVATTGVNHRLVCKQCLLPEKVLRPLYWVLSTVKGVENIASRYQP